MLIERITKERLESFFNNQKYLETLAKEIEGFRANYNFIKSSSSYASTRVSCGSKKMSEEEVFMHLCHKKSKEYEQLKKQLDSEKYIIETQIKRLTNPTYQKLLTRRYLLLQDWKLITMELFGHKDDWVIWGNTKYEILTMTLHRRAREQLIKISETAFLPEAEQKVLEV